jgi:hypothetical protein
MYVVEIISTNKVAHLAGSAAALLAFAFYRWFIYPTFISSLSRIPPAHPTCSYFPFWLWIQQRRGQENKSIFVAHQAHGPIVRLAPNEISVNSLEGIRKVYIGGFERTEWFQQFRNYDGTPNLVTFTDGMTHSARKRMLTHFYSKSYLLSSVDFQVLTTKILFERFLPSLEDAANDKEGVDVHEVGYAAGAEFMTAYLFGVENGMSIVKSGTEKVRRRYLQLSKVKMNGLKGVRPAIKELEVQCWDMCRRAEETLKKGLERGGDSVSATTYPVIYAQLRATISATEKISSETELRRLIASELIDSIEACRENCGVTLTYALWELSKNPHLQLQLRTELSPLQSSFSQENSPPFSTTTLRKLENSPLLEAIVKETLRLHPPAPGSQRRLTPERGAIIGGYIIPSGTIISSSPYTMHRNEDVYSSATVFRPERWLQAPGTTGEQLNPESETDKGVSQSHQRNWFFSFGQGGRMCIGSNFALLSEFFVTHLYNLLFTDDAPF